MLEELRIAGLGVIEDAVLELGSGLTVVTGETGAGKTMIIQGLALLFGGRADAGRVGGAAGRALVEGRLRLPADHPALLRAEDAGAELDQGCLLLSRSVTADGRSRAVLGGRTVPAGVLAEIGGLVLALHGQSDQERLLRPAEQRAALDRFAGEPVVSLRARFTEDWGRWRRDVAELATLRALAQERVREADLLRAGLAEVEARDPQPGESQALTERIARLAHTDDLRAAATVAQRALTGGEDDRESTDALSRLVHARRALEGVAGHDPQLDLLCGRATELGHLAADLGADLASYAAGVDADPAQLAAAQERLAALVALHRRLGQPDTDGVLAWAASASDRLLELDGTDERIAGLTEACGRLQQSLADLAGQLSAARAEAAQRFAAAVSAELAALAMPQARVSASVTQTAVPVAGGASGEPGAGTDGLGLSVDGRLLRAGPDGVDDVELLLTPHPGAPARPLQKGASGGELSRIMLAVEVVFAGADPVPVMVFDEVDAGVGGRAATEVGLRLARLAVDHQVIVVTHLPQVAAYADHHHLVAKAADGLVTRSGVSGLASADRVGELARMLAGHDSDLSRGHAEELLAAAARSPGAT